MSAHRRSFIVCASGFALASLFVAGCTAGAPSTGETKQETINPPLPSNLSLALNSKTTVSIGPFAQVSGDVASSGAEGSVLFDVSASQGFGRTVLAHQITVRVGASVGTLIGNDLTVEGSSGQQLLGLDPRTIPAVPRSTAAVAGSANLSVPANQSRQLCAGQFNVLSVGANATLNLNGGIYEVNQLTLAENARLLPSEPVVILVAGDVVTGTGAQIAPFTPVVNPMTASNIRIEVGGDVTLGDRSIVRAHLLVPGGRFSTGTRASLTGAAWANSITIGSQSTVSGETAFNATTPSVPPPCNDNNACTADQCVTSGTTVAFCRNTAVAAGSSCEDGNVCNGAEVCNATAQCLPGTVVAAGTSCADGDVCNGDETCNGFGSCRAGAPPVVNDGNSCTTDSCDPVGGVSNEPLADGTSCSGVGVCEAGTCSFSGALFSESFDQNSSNFAQCDAWNDFLRNGLVSGATYSRVSMSGTFNPTGFTCSDPVAATRVCRALHNGSFDSVFCDGHNWNIGQCNGAELTVDSFGCSCSFGNTVRPCGGFSFWGGINTQACNAPSQNLTVICE